MKGNMAVIKLNSEIIPESKKAGVLYLNMKKLLNFNF